MGGVSSNPQKGVSGDGSFIPAQAWAQCLKNCLSQGWLGGAPEGPSLCLGSNVGWAQAKQAPLQAAASHLVPGGGLAGGQGLLGLDQALVQEGHGILGRGLLLPQSFGVPVGGYS